MSAFVRKDMNGMEFLVECDGGDGEYLRISWDEDPDFRILWVEVVPDVTFRSKVKSAIKALRGRRHNNTGIILGPAKIDALKTFLSGLPE